MHICHWECTCTISIDLLSSGHLLSLVSGKPVVGHTERGLHSFFFFRYKCRAAFSAAYSSSSLPAVNLATFSADFCEHCYVHVTIFLGVGSAGGEHCLVPAEVSHFNADTMFLLSSSCANSRYNSISLVV